MDKKYQVKLKPCAAVFKQFNNIESCSLRLDEIEQRLSFELLCKHGIKKMYKIAFEECDSLQAVYSKENCLNRIVGFPKKLLDCINNFHNQLEEISLVVHRDVIKVKSHLDDAKAASKILQTELSLNPQDFEDYDIRNETAVTFTMKEAKTLLSFCESSGQPVTLLFERSGRPIIMSTKYFGVFESDFVLATLVDPSNSSNTSSGSQSTGTSGSISQNTNATPSSSPSSSSADLNITKKPQNDLSHSKRKAISPPLSPSPSSGLGADSGSIRSSTPLSNGIIAATNTTIPTVHNNNEEDEEEEDLYADYEVDASPEPPTKKNKTINEENILNEIRIASATNINHNDPPSEEEMVEDDEEEVPCSLDR